MKAFKVWGGTPLYGEVEISGSKNAALPVIFATLITRGISRIDGVPAIGDIDVAIEIIKSLGARVSRLQSTLFIDTEELLPIDVDQSLTSAIRASTYLLGSCLGRFSSCTVSDFGGCRFSDRPIDMHIGACLAFGGEISGNKIVAERLHPASISFSKPSVGATINALILAASVDGESTITGYAKEPHVINLCDYLRSAGAKICFLGDKITVKGGGLRGGRVRIIPDMIEAGTYLCAGIVTGGEVTVRSVVPDHLGAFISVIEQMGAHVRSGDNFITARAPKKGNFARAVARAYPGFPTDLHPITVPAMAVCGGGIMEDRVWEKRYGYLEPLKSFGLKYDIFEGGVRVHPSVFNSANVCSTDLRGGMSALLCALSARGESIVSKSEYILRGYEHPEIKLAALGAKIEPIRVPDPL